MKELKIEKGIPMLKYKKQSVFQSAINKMEEGDSVLFTDETPQFEYVAIQFATKIRSTGSLASCRKQPDGNYRVWMTKKKPNPTNPL